MDVYSAIRQRRSIRLFQNRPVPKEILLELADLARLYPSAGNLQPLRFGIITREPMREQVFACLRWAACLKDFTIPAEQRPQAYFVLLSNRVGCDFDAGAAAMSILLAAKAAGLDGCCLGIADKKRLAELLRLEDPLRPLAVIALGYGAQESAEDVYRDSCRYYQDETGKIHVPKLNVTDILLYSDL